MALVSPVLLCSGARGNNTHAYRSSLETDMLGPNEERVLFDFVHEWRCADVSTCVGVAPDGQSYVSAPNLDHG